MQHISYRIFVSFCILCFSLAVSAQMPVRLNERSISLNTSSGQINGKIIAPGASTYRWC